MFHKENCIWFFFAGAIEFDKREAKDSFIDFLKMILKELVDTKSVL